LLGNFGKHLTDHRAWRRFRRNRLAWGATALLGGMFIAAVACLPFSWSWFNVQDLHHAVRAEPSFAARTPYDSYGKAIAAGPFAGMVQSISPIVHPASGWFGYDDLGRSLLFRLSLGWLVSLAIGLGAAGMSVTLGVLWGSVAGLAGGRIDALMMRIVDVFYGLPYVLFVILLKVVMERPLANLFGGRTQLAGLVILFLAIGAVSWLTMARVVRGQVLSLRRQPFVEAARAGGAGTGRILFKHLLPNLVGPIVVCATLVIPQAILQESFLSFLGIGVQQPTPSLGRLASDGVQAVNTFVGFWWLILFPCGALVLTLLG